MGFRLNFDHKIFLHEWWVFAIQKAECTWRQGTLVRQQKCIESAPLKRAACRIAGQTSGISLRGARNLSL